MNWTWLLLVVPASLAAHQLALIVRRRWLRSENVWRAARITLLVTAVACFVAAYVNVVPLVMNGAAVVSLAIGTAFRKARNSSESTA